MARGGDRKPETVLPVRGQENDNVTMTMRPLHRTRTLVGRGLLLALFAVAAPAAAAPPPLPAIADPVSPEHHAGKVVFVELVTPDLGAAKRFYGGLFGWTFRDIDAGGTPYAEAMLDGDPVGGMLQRSVPAGEQRQPAWLTYFAVRDVDATEQAAVQQGAKVLFTPHSIPDRGRETVLADPQGAVFALLASSSGDPPDLLADPGDWIWTSLITSDPDTDAGFYQTLLGYDVFELPAENGAQHLMLASDGFSRASVNPLPANRPNVHPRWLNYVRVEDAAASVAKVQALGGRVLVAPRLEPDGGTVALVADPQGAPFGLLEWSETESKDAPK
jgi:predicted enzyme related to lactoylglutathione lyase